MKRCVKCQTLSSNRNLFCMRCCEQLVQPIPDGEVAWGIVYLSYARSSPQNAPGWETVYGWGETKEVVLAMAVEYPACTLCHFPMVVSFIQGQLQSGQPFVPLSMHPIDGNGQVGNPIPEPFAIRTDLNLLRM